MSNATIIAAAFGEGANLYEILGVAQDATPAQLRKAYYRKSLACHPDKVSGKEDIFQATTVAYNILKNESSRDEYNETGELVDDDDNDMNDNSFDAMKSYFKSVFGTVTTSKIDEFAQKYKCSEEEESHVLQYYKQFKGNLSKMLENVMLSTERDAQRWVEDYLTPAIESGEVPNYKKTLDRTLAQCMKKLEKEETPLDAEEEEVEVEVEAQQFDDDETESDNTDGDDAVEAKPVAAKKSKKAPAKKKPPAKKKQGGAKKKSKAQREAEEAEALMAKIRGKKTLANRKQGFDSMLGSLAAKYGGDEENNDGDPLDDAAFERIQANMTKKKKKKSK